MSRGMWIISFLIVILMISSFWFSKNREAPPWVKCKESLFAQVVLKQCTPSSFSTPYKESINGKQEEFPDELPYEPPQN